MGEAARGISRWRPSDGKGKVVGLYICTMRRYAPSQYRQVLLRAPTAALYCISSPTTASTFALACCDDFCQLRAKLYWTYCKRAFGKPQSGKSAQQARANAYFFRRSVACIGNSSSGPLTQPPHFGAHLTMVPFSQMPLRRFLVRHATLQRAVQSMPQPCRCRRPFWHRQVPPSHRGCAL